MPLSVNGLTLAHATIVFYAMIMLFLAYMAWGFGDELKQGKNGITLSLMFLFISLANEHFYLAVVSWLVLNRELYTQYELGIWLWRFLTLALIIASFIVLFVEFRSAKNGRKSR